MLPARKELLEAKNFLEILSFIKEMGFSGN